MGQNSIGTNTKESERKIGHYTSRYRTYSHVLKILRMHDKLSRNFTRKEKKVDGINDSAWKEIKNLVKLIASWMVR